MPTTVLAFLPEGVEEIEFVTPVDIWRRAGFEVTIAALRYCPPSLAEFRLVRSRRDVPGSKDLAAKGRSNITITADVDLDTVAARDFDCIFCPGGPGTKLLREDARVVEIVKRHAAADKKIAAICAAPTVLKVAVLIVGLWFLCACQSWCA